MAEVSYRDRPGVMAPMTEPGGVVSGAACVLKRAAGQWQFQREEVTGLSGLQPALPRPHGRNEGNLDDIIHVNVTFTHFSRLETQMMPPRTHREFLHPLSLSVKWKQ